MDAKDLLTLLDLDGTPPNAITAAPELSIRTESHSPMPGSATALDVDAWGLRRGRDLIAESERLQKAGTGDFAAADFFTASFDPDPRLLDEPCLDPRRKEFLAQLL